MTNADFDQIFNNYELLYRTDAILGNVGSYSEGMHEMMTEFPPGDIANDGISLEDRMFFSMNTEYVPIFMVPTPKRDPKRPFISMYFQRHGSSFSPRVFSYRASCIQRPMVNGAHLYSMRGMTLLHKSIDDDETSARIVYTMVAHSELFDKLKAIFDRSKSGVSQTETYVKAINSNPGKLQLWIDDQLYFPNDAIHMRNERAKIKRFVVQPLMNAGIPIRYMDQNVMRNILSPFSQESGKFTSFAELQKDKETLLANSLQLFEKAYPNARV